MKVDAYTKVVLTAIAVGVWLNVLKPVQLSQAVAQKSRGVPVVNVNLAAIGGKPIALAMTKTPDGKTFAALPVVISGSLYHLPVSLESLNPVFVDAGIPVRLRSLTPVPVKIEDLGSSVRLEGIPVKSLMGSIPVTIKDIDLSGRIFDRGSLPVRIEAMDIIKTPLPVEVVGVLGRVPVEIVDVSAFLSLQGIPVYLKRW